jgi:hypothetical protein
MEANDGRDTTLGAAEPGPASAAHGLGPVHIGPGQAPGAGSLAARPDGGPGGSLGALGEAFREAGHEPVRTRWRRWQVVALLLVLLAAIMLAGPLWWLLGVRLAL